MIKLVSGLFTVLLASNLASADFAKAPADAKPVVETKLVAPRIDRGAVMTALAARREHNIASFRAYVTSGVYPRNRVRSGPLNVWQDGDGRLCAAATMIYRDGKHDLVIQTAKEHNNIRLLDVVDGELMAWILTSGLTLEEIDRIQEPGFQQPIAQRDASSDTKEVLRLRASYDKTLAFLDDDREAGLAEATDRLMENPLLARQLLDATPAR